MGTTWQKGGMANNAAKTQAREQQDRKGGRGYMRTTYNQCDNTQEHRAPATPQEGDVRKQCNNQPDREGDGGCKYVRAKPSYKLGRGRAQSIEGGEQYPDATGGWANSSMKWDNQTSQATRQEGGARTDQCRAGEAANNTLSACKHQHKTGQSNKEHSKLGSSKAAIVLFVWCCVDAAIACSGVGGSQRKNHV